jgi:hypothetical protein
MPVLAFSLICPVCGHELPFSDFGRLDGIKSVSKAELSRCLKAMK